MEWRSGAPLLSAVAQSRGSIPLHWAQRPDSSMLKPEIVLQSFDPLYAATRRHFDALRAQYGDPLCLLDLVKRGERRPREGLLGGEYEAAVRCAGAGLGGIPRRRRRRWRRHPVPGLHAGSVGRLLFCRASAPPPHAFTHQHPLPPAAPAGF